jgi:glyoxylase-like metal-dependent hydrolase (beta-lactamase superfamily II)
MKIGKYTVHLIESGAFALDGGAMFGVVPKTLWTKANPADEKNRIAMVTRNILLVSDNRKILVDTGMGNKWDEKARDIYKIDQAQNSLTRGLAQLGISAEDITDVLLTHLHFDHTGGSTVMVNGTTIPAFPNATYYVQKSNFDWALEPTERDKGSYLRENFEPLARAGVLKVLDDSVEQLDHEIEVMRFNGHTRGQQLFKLTDGTTTLFYCGDLIPTASHVPLPYIMGYDLQPLITLQEKKYLLETALEENWILCFEHDAVSACATLKAGEKGITIAERYAGLPA